MVIYYVHNFSHVPLIHCAETYKHAITGKAVTVKFNDNVLAESNIRTTDWLTGVSYVASMPTLAP